MAKEKKIRNWVRKHKKGLCVVAFTVAGGIVLVKNWDSIKKLFEDTDILESVTQEVVPVVAKQTELVDSNILENLTGNKLTARDLGNKMLCSAQMINKRLVASGFAVRWPDGEYSMTDKGKLFGESKWKTLASGHSFSNIEWDEKILDLLFSPEEHQKVSEFKTHAKEITGASAA